MENHYLTKSDFKVARTCATKLYFRKLRYATREDGDEYLAMLADQGYLLEAIARALYPEGRWVGSGYDVEAAAWDTMTALAEDNCTLFEATFISRGKLARIDILVKRGDVLELIEIKSRGFDRQAQESPAPEARPNPFRQTHYAHDIRAEWRPYLEDVTFQYSILEELFSGVTIVPFLLMPDTSQPCAVDGIHRRFTMQAADGPANEAPRAVYDGDLRELRRGLFITRVNVSAEVQTLLPAVREAAAQYAASLTPAVTRVATPPSVNCRACEYRLASDGASGFRECWSALADARPHILDLYHVSSLHGRDGALADELIAAGKASLFDIPLDRVTKRDGQIGEIARRQLVQLRYTREDREWLGDEIGDFMRSVNYPLHFVDFETCSPSIPRYRGMRPFDTIAFQWSCQTLATPDAVPDHHGWIQTGDIYPNAGFATSLRRLLGDTGTILVWGSHEATVMRAVARQLVERGQTTDGLDQWLQAAAGRVVDMNQLTLRHYFHPHMAGRTSIKIVAEAVWRASAAVRERLPEYGSVTGGDPAGPYASLPPVLVGGRHVSVTDGTGAILAYYALMERAAAGSNLEAERWRQLLQQYCQLDTLAMVMVWWRWQELAGQLE